jgi:hypothetical protein
MLPEVTFNRFRRGERRGLMNRVVIQRRNVDDVGDR